METFNFGKTTLAKAVKASLRKSFVQEAAKARPWQFLTKHWRMVTNHLRKMSSHAGRYAWRTYTDTFQQHWQHVSSPRFREDCGDTYILGTIVWNYSLLAAHDAGSLAQVQAIADMVSDLRDTIGKMASKESQAGYGNFVKGFQASRQVHRLTKIPPPATLTFAKNGTTC